MAAQTISKTYDYLTASPQKANVEKVLRRLKPLARESEKAMEHLLACEIEGQVRVVRWNLRLHILRASSLLRSAGRGLSIGGRHVAKEAAECKNEQIRIPIWRTCRG